MTKQSNQAINIYDRVVAERVFQYLIQDRYPANPAMEYSSSESVEKKTITISFNVDELTAGTLRAVKDILVKSGGKEVFFDKNEKDFSPDLTGKEFALRSSGFKETFEDGTMHHIMKLSFTDALFQDVKSMLIASAIRKF